MKNVLIALTVLLFGSSHVVSKEAPDFEAVDVDKKKHNLYQDLDGGQFVLVDFFASY